MHYTLVRSGPFDSLRDLSNELEKIRVSDEKKGRGILHYGRPLGMLDMIFACCLGLWDMRQLHRFSFYLFDEDHGFLREVSDIIYQNYLSCMLFVIF